MLGGDDFRDAQLDLGEVVDADVRVGGGRRLGVFLLGFGVALAAALLGLGRE